MDDKGRWRLQGAAHHARRARRVERWVGHQRYLAAALLMAALVTTSQPGCSLFVMAGKAILGDPELTSAFKAQTKVDLAKEHKKIVIICSAPHSIKSEYPSVEFELIDGVARQLKLKGVDVVNPDRVATWMDDHGGYDNNPEGLGLEFDADYVVHIDLAKFTLREDNSPSLWRGHIDGKVIAYQLVEVGGKKVAQRVFEREYTSHYPAQYPISVEQKSLKIFSKEYLGHVSLELARIFHDYRASDAID